MTTNKNAAGIVGMDGTAAPALKPRKPLKWTRANLLKVADEIYNPKTGDYLHLCSGSLHSTMKGERMSCAIGHLSYRFQGEESISGTDSTCAQLAGRKFDVLTRTSSEVNPGVYESLRQLYQLNDDDRFTRFRDRARAVAHYIRTKIAPLVSNG